MTNSSRKTFRREHHSRSQKKTDSMQHPHDFTAADTDVAAQPAEKDSEFLTTLLPGIKPVLELLETAPQRVDTVFLRKGKHGNEADAVINLCREKGIRFVLLDSPAYTKIYSGHSQGVVARLFNKGFMEFDELLDSVMAAPLPVIIALDQVQDPGNAGTLARTLYALGGAGLVIPRHNGVYLGAAAVKASAGALEHLPVAKAHNLAMCLDQAKKMGFTIYGAAAESATEDFEKDLQATGAKKQAALVPTFPLFSLTPRFPAILILGSEESGMRLHTEKRCHMKISIPMLRSFDSLNVAQAGAIILAWLAHHAEKKHG